MIAPAVGKSLRDEIASEGFAIVQRIFDESCVRSLLDAIDRYFSGAAARERHAIRDPAKVIAPIADLADGRAVRNLVEQILGSDAFLVHSLFFDKTPEANWNVPWHQDVMITVDRKADDPHYGPWSLKDGLWHVQPPRVVLERMLTVRVHLDNCDYDNGPLRVLPASHRSGILSTEQIDAWRHHASAVTCAVARGGALLLRPLLLHASSRAKTPQHRRVLHLEFAADPLPGNLRWLRQ